MQNKRNPTDTFNKWLYLGWFATLQALVFCLIGSMHVFSQHSAQGLLAGVYLLGAFLMHYSLLAYLSIAGVCLPMVFLRIPGKWLVRASIVVFAVTAAILLVETLLYQQRQFHLNRLTMQLLGWQTWAFALFYLVIFLAMANLVSKQVIKHITNPERRKLGKWVALSLVVSTVSSQSLHIWADATSYRPITQTAYTMPLYYPQTAKSLLSRLELIDIEKSRQINSQLPLADKHDRLNYPLAKMQCQPEHPKNILMIVIDAMRADMLNIETSPNLVDFARVSQQFNQHYSGGNSSRSGIFSLFYGLPGNYWQDFMAQQTAPVIMDIMQQHGYKFAILGSSPLYRPTSLDKTAFANIKDLRVRTPPENGEPWQRDLRITTDWLNWLAEHDKRQPFFGFLYYDGPTTESASPEFIAKAEQQIQHGAEPEHSLYRTSVAYVDSLIARVLADLKQQQLLDNTVVAITADHGIEFDDNQLGYQGYGNAFTQVQLQVPFILHWPAKSASTHDYKTSHNDLVVTLAESVLNCSNPSSDYSSGKHLFKQTDWPWLIANSYHNFAILGEEQTVVSHFNGSFELRDNNYQLLDKALLDIDLVSEAIAETTRFYQGDK